MTSLKDLIDECQSQVLAWGYDGDEQAAEYIAESSNTPITIVEILRRAVYDKLFSIDLDIKDLDISDESLKLIMAHKLGVTND